MTHIMWILCKCGIYYQLQLGMLAYISIALGVIFLALYLITRKPAPPQPSKVAEAPPKVEQKETFGRIRIYYGTQTGTAAKLAEQLADEATEQGFQPQVIDLKDLQASHFESFNEVSLFLLANTGEGDPPENTVRFLKFLRGKQQLDSVREIDWKIVNFSVFGLGNTQYEHFNKTGIDIDALLQKNGGKRIYKLGLGDDNCSLEDDFTEWRKDLWKTLKQFRRNNPLREAGLQEKLHRKISSESQDEAYSFLSKIQPTLANYRLFFKKGKEEEYPWHEDDLDFKTKASLKAEQGVVRSVRQLRQDEKDGSTLEIQVELPGQPDYQTAGNIALYAKNDPKIIQQAIQYFQIPQSVLQKKLALVKLKEDKKIKLNFFPNNLKTLLEQSVDLQGKLSKSTLKKLAKFPSNSPEYFTQNSLKTTKEFQRITDEKEWYYLIRIIREYQVKLCFEDFLQLSDSMAPRVFTIASHAHAQRNVIVAASLTENGLISKYFLTKQNTIKAELRKSTFTSIGRWKKIVLIGAGTGLAPFRGFLQEKQRNVKLKQQGKDAPTPIVTLFFGCKHQNGDFIYKDEILAWKNASIIDRLHLAFSRDSNKKVYVQDLLAREEEELKQLGHCEETALYICGSLPMGKAIIDVLTHTFGAQRVKAMEEAGRIVKELW